jgi:acyl carrier protein
MESTFDILTRLLEQQLGVERDKMSRDSDLVVDLGADDLDIVEFSMLVEDEFDIQIPDEETDSLSTIADWEALVEKKCGLEPA